MVKLKINGIEVEAQNGETILEASRRSGFDIPTLCHLQLHDMDYENRPVSCRICMVEVDEGRGSRLVPSCDTYVKEGMDISTDSRRAVNSRRTTMELMLSNHPKDCLFCDRSTNCDLQTLAHELNVRRVRYEGKRSNFGIDETSLSIVKNLDKCILCRRCESICSNVQTVDIYSAVNRGFDTVIAPAFNAPLHETECTFCGQCVSVCPTAALTEINNVDKVWNALYDEGKYVVVQTAPAVRVAVAEEFGAEPGTVSTGQMVAALRRLGFDSVFDTNWGADLTIMEEANEVLQRLNGKGRLPILTSCCPAWVKFIEHNFPDMLDVPSTCKSPHEMFGSMTKTYFAEKMNIDPKDIVVVSVMPCVAKKYESARPELTHEGHSDVDYVITTREFARMVKEAGIHYLDLAEEEFDNPLGESTGAAQIFGATGGVLEAALRTAAAWLGDESDATLDFEGVRGFEGVKEANISVAGHDLKVAAAHGLGNARRLLEAVREGSTHYDVIEIMACPGGCIAGGGQPYHHGDRGIIKKRMEATYSIDKSKKIRRSNDNPDIKKIYEEFLGEPGSHKAHELLHTHYVDRGE
ncbi:NADH-dependent [FeFe] hydrogenase, group A6 [Culicoidibacter larvae]|nr:NADH-dependent [FeFe] hydrogenase, group A6 [Culicoidibacter larvae]